MMGNDNSRVGPGHALALVVALPEEVSGILKAGDWQRVPSSASLATYQGRVGGREAIIAVSGVGRSRAEATAREVIEEHHPDAVLSLGFAGGLTEESAVGDLVVAQAIMSIDNSQDKTGVPGVSEPLASDEWLVRDALHVLASRGLKHHSGACLTTSQIASDPGGKTYLAKATGALAVEMESFWIGLVCQEHNVPYLAVRAIVDTVGHRLPAYVAEYAFEVGTKSRWRQATPALLRPWRIPGLVRLGAASARARDGLTAFAVAFMEWRTQESVAPVAVK